MGSAPARDVRRLPRRARSGVSAAGDVGAAEELSAGREPVDPAHAGEVLLTAQTIVNEGAVLKVGGVVSTRFALTVINNPDGTQSLVAQRKGLLVIFR